MTDKIILTAVSDYPEVPVSEGGMFWNETGIWRFVSPCFSPRPSPCSRACPLENDIPEIMRRVSDGDIEGAWDALAWEDPFPALLGRVCPGFCMADCNRGLLDERVSIRDIERFLGDRFSKQGPPVKGPRTGKSIGIVGSGPAGLSAAYFLTLMGHSVSVFEKEAHPGGTPRLGIPPYRLSGKALDAVVGGIRAMGVAIHTGREIRKEDLPELSSSHDAVFVAHGAHVGTAMGIDGEILPGVSQGIGLLKGINAGTIRNMSGDYLVIGGGNTALDAARALKRLGGRPTVVYRRGREAMPAFADEIQEALEEKIPIEFFRAPVKIERGSGERLLVSLISMRPGEPDDSGRPRPIPVAGTEQVVEVDGVFSAVGETVDPALVEGGEVRGTGGGPIIVIGDAAGGPRTVAHAAASGKRAALRIDLMLSGGRTVPDERASGSFRAYREGRSIVPIDPVRFEELNADYFERVPSVAAKRRSPEARVLDFSEVTGTYSPKAALAESGRCFVCGSCVGCEICATFCPDFSISVQGDSASIDYTYCKGCGICIRECPRGVIVTGKTGG